MPNTVNINEEIRKALKKSGGSERGAAKIVGCKPITIRRRKEMWARLQGRISAILQERASERTVWSSSALADTEGTISEGDGAEQDWSQDRLTDPSWWLLEPNVGRVANGVPARVDRIRALGNSIVPQIAEMIGRSIMEYENDRA